MLYHEKTIKELKNLKYLPIFGNYFLTNKFVDKLCEKDGNFVYAVKTTPDENTEKLTVFTFLEGMKNQNECFVQVRTKTNYKNDFGKPSSLKNLEYLKFERFYDSNIILCTHYTAVNGLDGRPHILPLPNSCLLRADPKSTSPLGIDFINIKGFVFANKIESFKFSDFHNINHTSELHKDPTWAELQSR